MSPEDKNSSSKKFKAVTEELTAPDNEHSSAEKPKEEVKELGKEAKGSASTSGQVVAVQETKNIVSDPVVKHNANMFLKVFLITFFATLLALVLVGGIYVYVTGTQKAGTEPTPVPTETAAPGPTELPMASSTPVAKVDLSSYKVSVLNGNGGIGVAGTARAIIEKAGFKVTYIGNADNFSFTDTLIQVKAGVSGDVVKLLKDSLVTTYSVEVGDTLDSQSSYDIVVTVGSK